MEAITGIHPVVAQTFAVLAALVFLAGFGKAVVMPLLRALRQVGQFLDDWYGREEDPDRPGIRERLVATEEKVRAIHQQTHMNGGASLKDVVVRTEQKVDTAVRKIDDHVEEAAEHIRRIGELEAHRDGCRCREKEQP